MSRRTTLYRAYDHTDALLYVGIAYDWPNRWQRHAERSPWYSQVTRLELEHFDDRDDAERREAEVVAAEHPRHNIEHTARDTRPSRRKADAPDLYVPSFDHRHLANVAAYRKVCLAIDELAKTWPELKPTNQEGLAQAVANVARAVPYGDSCPRCSELAFVVEAKVTGSQIEATYVCCNRPWRSWWAVDAPLWMP